MRFYKSIFLFLLICSFSIIGFGQTEESEENAEVIVPEQAMEQVVRRILIWQFKPRKKPTTIHLAEQYIQKSWLPTIKNIEFKLLSEEEIEQEGKDVYFFTKPEKDGNKFGIVFAFGNPNCVYTGDYWHFRVLEKKIRLWENGIVGSGCSNDASTSL